MAEIDKQTGKEIVWISDATYLYKRSRQWFNNRIDKGRIRTAPQVGTNRIYLIKEDIEKEVDKGEDE